MNLFARTPVLAVLVSYNGGPIVAATAEAACCQVDELLIIDNHSQQDSIDVIEGLAATYKNIIVRFNSQNIGLAAALNQGIAYAAEKEFRYILTLDQDSLAQPAMVAELQAACQTDSSIGIASPWMYWIADGKVMGGDPPSQVPYSNWRVWTGGSFSPVDVLVEVGGFPEDFFIDYVDYALCHKVLKAGLKVVVVPSAHMIQRRGELFTATLGGRKLFCSNYSATRRYYIARNGLVLSRQMKSLTSLKEHLSLLAKETVKVSLFEASKGPKLWMTALGILHAAIGRMGPLRRQDRHLS
jgi:rhamnosyltransferase